MKKLLIIFSIFSSFSVFAQLANDLYRSNSNDHDKIFKENKFVLRSENLKEDILEKSYCKKDPIKGDIEYFLHYKNNNTLHQITIHSIENDIYLKYLDECMDKKMIKKEKKLFDFVYEDDNFIYYFGSFNIFNKETFFVTIERR